MKTNATISSSIIALLMMMLFSHASHAATIIQQNDTVSQLLPVYYEQTVEYYAEALADVETLVRFYISFLSFSLLLRRNGRRTGRDAQKCGGNHRARRERRIFKSSRYTRLWSSRASFSRCSLDDDDDGCEKFEISRGKIKQRAARIDTMMMIMIMIMMIMMMLTIFIFSLSSSLSRTHIRIQMHYTDDRTFIEY